MRAGSSLADLSCIDFILPHPDFFLQKVFDCNSPRSDYLFTPGEYLTMIFEKPLGKQKYNFSIVVTSYESGK